MEYLLMLEAEIMIWIWGRKVEGKYLSDPLDTDIRELKETAVGGLLQNKGRGLSDREIRRTKEKEKVYI